MTPTKILDYKINRLIGEGGMAKVYEADLDRELGTKVAIKVLDKKLASEKSLRERFKQEAKSMLNLKHPYIVNVLNFVEEEDTLAIVMEYVEGETLKDMVEKNGPIAPVLAVHILKEILEAMQYVHDKGVIHRDIKPSNIFIIEGKYPKILDFGIVKVLGGESTTKTKTGLTIGTPMYMSPEQVQTPQNIDYRTDIYSLGVTFHYMLAGGAPYDSTESEFSIQTKVVKEPLPKLSSIPLHLTNTISMATHKNRERRLSNCNMFIEELNLNNISNDSTVIENRKGLNNGAIKTTEYFILDDNNQQEGPYTLNQLKKVSISKTTKAWHQGMQGWSNAESIIELEELFFVKTPPPPPTYSPPPPPVQEPIIHTQKNKQPLANSISDLAYITSKPIYEEIFKISNLSSQEIEDYKRNLFHSTFNVWVGILLHYLTFGIFTVIYCGLQHSKLPKLQVDDFSGGKAIGFLFIPIYNFYWYFMLWRRLVKRINFQFTLRNESSPISYGLATAMCIVNFIPYLGYVINYLVIMPILFFQIQSSINNLTENNMNLR